MYVYILWLFISWGFNIFEIWVSSLYIIYTTVLSWSIQILPIMFLVLILLVFYVRTIVLLYVVELFIFPLWFSYCPKLFKDTIPLKISLIFDFFPHSSTKNSFQYFTSLIWLEALIMCYKSLSKSLLFCVCLPVTLAIIKA